MFFLQCICFLEYKLPRMDMDIHVSGSFRGKKLGSFRGKKLHAACIYHLHCVLCMRLLSIDMVTCKDKELIQ